MAEHASTKSSQDKGASQTEEPTRALAHQSAPSGPHANVLALQCAAGNRAVGELLQPTTSFQPSVRSSIPPIVDEVLRSPGQPLDRSTRAFMESRFGHDFSQVRVHTDARAAESVRAVNAQAYTVGQNVVFDTAQYAPDISAGRRLLAHELAHVVQQRRGGTTPPSLLSNNVLDQTADQAASAIVESNSPVHVAGASAPGLARQPKDPRHARGYAGEQGMGFELYPQSEGWIFIEGPSGAAGHGVTTSGFDGVAYNLKTDELHLIDNKSFKSPGNVRSATAIDPSKNLPQNIDALIKRVEAAKDTPGRIRILDLLRKTRAALIAKQPLPDKVKPVVTGIGGKSTGVSPRLRAQGVEFRPAPPPKVKAVDSNQLSSRQGATAGSSTAPKESAPNIRIAPPKLRFAPPKLRVEDEKPRINEMQDELRNAEAEKEAQAIDEQSALEKSPRVMQRSEPQSQVATGNSALDGDAEETRGGSVSPPPSRGAPSGEKAAAQSSEVQRSGGRGPSAPLDKGSTPPKGGGPSAPPGGTKSSLLDPAKSPSAGTESPAGAAKQSSKGSTPAQPPSAIPPGSEKGDESSATEPKAGSLPVNIDPAPNAEAIGWGAVMGLQAIHQALSYFVEKDQRQKAEIELEAQWPDIQRALKETGQGVLIFFEYTEHRSIPNSGVPPGITFDRISWKIGGPVQTPPDTVRGGGVTPQFKTRYIPPLKEAATRTDAGAARYRLDQLWTKLKLFQKAGERMAHEWPTGRLMKGRKQVKIDIQPIYEARSHLSSATIAIQQGRFDDAQTSMNYAELLLVMMLGNFTSYTGTSYDYEGH